MADLAPAMSTEVATYILAGGASRRMGTDKVRLELDGENVAHVLARRFAPCTSGVALVVKPWQDFADLGLPLVRDDAAGHALVHGIRAALACPGPKWRLLLACDMPGVMPEVLARLWAAVHAHAAPGACLQRQGRDDVEPLPSLWHRDIAGRIRDSWGMAARDWLRHAGAAVVGTSAADPALANMNTPPEWRSYRGNGVQGGA